MTRPDTETGVPPIPSAKTTPACPICGAPRKALHRPFCSRRCQEIDLGRWFSGRYAVPTLEPPDGIDEDRLDGSGTDEDDPDTER